MNMPKAPTPPNYNKIIEEELKKIKDDSFAKKIKKILMDNQKKRYYINSAYNDARIEAFIASANARMDAEYEIYCMNLDKYEMDLKKFDSNLNKQIIEYEKQCEIVKIDFSTAKGFYDRFQNLVSKKVLFFNGFLNKILSISDDNNVSEDELKEEEDEDEK